MAAKRYLQSLTPRAKTDAVDARGLARFGQDRALPPYQLKEASLQRLGELLRVRRGLARALAALRQQRQVLPLAAPETDAAATAVRAQLAHLDRELRAAGQQIELFGRLHAVPGIGLVTAAALTVHLRARRFPRADAFVAYLGLDVRVCDSGTRRGRRRLTKHGDAQGRWLCTWPPKPPCAPPSIRAFEPSTSASAPRDTAARRPAASSPASSLGSPGRWTTPASPMTTHASSPRPSQARAALVCGGRSGSRNLHISYIPSKP